MKSLIRSAVASLAISTCSFAAVPDEVDAEQHHLPHIHAQYQGQQAQFAIDTLYLRSVVVKQAAAA